MMMMVIKMLMVIIVIMMMVVIKMMMIIIVNQFLNISPFPWPNNPLAMMMMIMTVMSHH